MPDYSPIMALMKEYGAPMTRDEFVKWNNLGKSKKVSAEEEAELPARFAYPVVTHEELPQRKEPKGQMQTEKFFSNPSNVEPQDDTAQPAPVKNPLKSTQNAPLKPPPMSIENGKSAGMEPDPMVPRLQ